MSWMKLLVSQTSIATLTCSLLASFTTIANAKPFVEKIQRQSVPNTEITGNIIKGDARVEDIPCSQITVTLKEFIPTKPEPDRFNVPKEKTIGEQVSATGTNLSEGCSYTLAFRYLPKIGAYGASTFQIIAQQTNGVSGSQPVSDPFPNNIDIQVFPLPDPPR
jgi:hypothetical protein